MRKKSEALATTAPAPTNGDTNVKSNLDAAWAKIQDGRQQEDAGKKLWIEGTLELVSILDEARKSLGSDQAFGAWLTENGYGEDRITRHDRAALLNMALHLQLTREVLQQTNRRSWRYIWEEEVQPRLPYVGQPADATSSATPAPTLEQPADGATPDAPAATPDDKSSEKTPASTEQPVEEPPPTTRRPKKERDLEQEEVKKQKRNSKHWLGNAVATINGVTDEFNKVMANATAEQHDLLADLELTLLVEASRNLEKKAAEFVAWVTAPLEEPADAHRTVITPAPKRAGRVANQVQPGV
jgi:hypothetical protein